MLSARLTRTAAIVLLGATASITACAPHGHPHGAGDARTNVVTVTGTGKISRKPDIARATVGVEVTASTVVEATRLASERMTALIAALKTAGIAEKDIQTSNYSINFERTMDHPPPPMLPTPVQAPPISPRPEAAPRRKGGDGPVASPVAPPIPPPPAGPAGFYRVSNTVALTVRELAKLGATLDAAVANGANNVWGISFAIDKPEAYEAEARLAAVEDAKKRAAALAQAEGRALGPVVAVSDSAGGGGIVRPMAYSMKSEAMNTPVESGEIEISAQVEVVYRLAPAAE